MYFSDFHFASEVLGIQTAAYVLLPDEKTMCAQNGKLLPTLYLLHGLYDDHTGWMRQTRLEQYAREYRVAIVMPAVNRSFYTDMVHGAKYFTFVSEELPRVMERCFPLSHERDERFVAGLSMGGYGAMKLGLRYPERYSYVASLSGVLEIEKAYETRQDAAFLSELDDIFGGEAALKGSENNLSLLAQRLVDKHENMPKIYVACGREDSLFQANESFVERFGTPLNISYHAEAGDHTWDFWDHHIQRVLAWLPLEQATKAW